VDDSRHTADDLIAGEDVMLERMSEGRAPRRDLDYRLRVIESTYGREHGWFVEQDGRTLALLTDPRWIEMFWESYRLVPATEDPRDLTRLRAWPSGNRVI
jgi:hypothetical protein